MVVHVQLPSNLEAQPKIRSARLTDAASGKELLSVEKRGIPAEIRSMSHDVANEVVKYFTGQSGIFNSKIVFVNRIVVTF